MQGQLSIFDWMPTLQTEPEVGEYVEKHGSIICHVMRESYVGEKVVYDCSTQSRTWYKVGVLEAVVPAYYWKRKEDGTYVKVECDRSIIYTGKAQRALITHMPGQEIFECLPWDAYPERMKAIGGKK